MLVFAALLAPSTSTPTSTSSPPEPKPESFVSSFELASLRASSARLTRSWAASNVELADARAVSPVKVPS